MTINELIAELEAVRAEHGDIEVSIDDQVPCGGDEMLWIDPKLRYWQYEEDRWAGSVAPTPKSAPRSSSSRKVVKHALRW